ncbi:MAG: dUTP diphosphatase [Chitinophagales bacterium]|nr:dUTP diphosphatase [Chitinophagales bacterium]
MLNIRIINKSANANPEYATIHAAGMDLKADISEKMEILPLDRCLVPTGIFIELPIGYEAQIRPRSGLAINSGITLLNSPGTIDADYRGEIKVIMINLSKQPFYINPGDKIAQMVVAKHEIVVWENTTELSSTDRDTGGFGHTGK